MPVSRTALATAALCLSAAPGLAGCPTGEDIVQGIVLAQNEPYFLRGDFKATGDGFEELRISEVTGRRQQITARYRHGLVMTREQTAAGTVEIDYLEDPLPVDTLPDAGQLTLSGLARAPGGDTAVTLELAFDGHDTVALAECVFDTWTVTSTLRGGTGSGNEDGTAGGTTFQLDYAPELDLVLAARQIGPDGTATPTFAYQWAGTAADVAR